MSRPNQMASNETNLSLSDDSVLQENVPPGKPSSVSPQRRNARDGNQDKKQTPGRCVLDSRNWISSSDDDILLSNGLTMSEDALKDTHRRTYRRKPSMSLHKSLFSSPVLDRIAPTSIALDVSQDMEDADTGIHEEPSQKQDSDYIGIQSQTSLTEDTREKALVAEGSDPIECSPATSPIPKRRRTARPATARKATASKEWLSANKAIRRKTDILSEMVVEVAYCIKDFIRTEYFDSVFTLPTVRYSYLELPLISWKRRVKARYDKANDVFVPCELHETSEQMIVLCYTANELFTRIQNNELAADLHKSKERVTILDHHVKAQPVILVEKVAEYLRNLQAKEDKHYRLQMLSQMSDCDNTDGNSNTTLFTASAAQELLVATQVKLGVNIFVSRSSEETTDWLHAFTYTIGNSLYDKFQRNPELATMGSIRLKSDSRSAFMEMMKRFNMMTAPKVEKLYQFYTSPMDLYRRFCGHDNLGTVNGKNIVPPSVNNAMRKVFTSLDPDQVITD